MANVALSQISRMGGISTAADGRYIQYPTLNNIVGAARTLKTLFENAEEALEALDTLMADPDNDGRILLAVRGANGETQFAPNAAFRAACAAVVAALQSAQTTVSALTLPTP